MRLCLEKPGTGVAGIPSLLAHIGNYPYIPVWEAVYSFTELLLLVRLDRSLRGAGDSDSPPPQVSYFNIIKYGDPKGLRQHYREQC